MPVVVDQGPFAKEMTELAQYADDDDDGGGVRGLGAAGTTDGRTQAASKWTEIYRT